ncbi:MAG TPA: carcinine hydrolase/isopenicillin-N N-acyltransferase family protein [Spirochaetia bacterium]|nr:carcinine hydrolase/isopenicillin-N N-acyltransferase family protein [Spirochaetia bacterium]
MRVEAAFDSDGFSVRPVMDPDSPGAPRLFVQKDGWIGMLAEHGSAKNHRTARPKRAYYVEGDAWHRGYLLGLLAEQEVSRMTGEFLKKVIFAFFDSGVAQKGGLEGDIQDLIATIAAGATKSVLPDVPPELLEEIKGIHDGCAAARPGTTVTREDLETLNFGVDAILAHVYSGEIFARRGIDPRLLRTPIGCNAFSLSGAAADGRHFFGRDFMFPTADVFQDTACLLIVSPEAPGRPFVSQTAPGFVGSMAAMNIAGFAMGVNMLATRLCDPHRPGFNSLGLVRDCVQHCGSADEAVGRVAAAQRGVTWLYPMADAHGRAFVVETGRKPGRRELFPYYAYVPWRYRRRLPTRGYIRRMRRRYGTPSPRQGVFPRANTYHYPFDYVLDWNERLYKAFDRDWFVKLTDFLMDLIGAVVNLFCGRIRSLWHSITTEIEEMHIGAAYEDADFGEKGFINQTWKDHNCPGPFYFAPQRESRPDVVLATNHPVSPEMRLTAMNEWIALLTKANVNDIQWRYDELNREILDALERSPQGVSEETAWDLVSFLRPDGRFPEYYNPGGAGSWQDVQVHGSITLCELTGVSMKSLFGCYGDEPVTVHLRRYF